MSEWAYRLATMGPWQHKRVGLLEFGVARQAGCWIAQISAERWDAAVGDEVAVHVAFMVVYFHCLWVWKGRTDVSERVYRDLEGLRGTINMLGLD